MEEVYNAKLPTAIKELEYTPLRTWIMQRLGVEQSNIEPVPGAEVATTTPGAGGHRTQGAGANES